MSIAQTLPAFHRLSRKIRTHEHLSHHSEQGMRGVVWMGNVRSGMGECLSVCSLFVCGGCWFVSEVGACVPGCLRWCLCLWVCLVPSLVTLEW